MSLTRTQDSRLLQVLHQGLPDAPFLSARTSRNMENTRVIIGIGKEQGMQIPFFTTWNNMMERTAILMTPVLME